MRQMPFPVAMYTIKNEDTNLSIAKHIKYCDKKEEPNHRHSNSQRSPPREKKPFGYCLLLIKSPIAVKQFCDQE